VRAKARDILEREAADHEQRRSEAGPSRGREGSRDADAGRQHQRQHEQPGSGEQREAYRRSELRGGWIEEVWTAERRDPGSDKSVRRVRVRVTAPSGGRAAPPPPPSGDGPSGSDGGGDDDGGALFGEGEHEEWVGDGGAGRRRTLVALPRRFSLARKAFGDEPFASAGERRAAKALFGGWAVGAKRLLGALGWRRQ